MKSESGSYEPHLVIQECRVAAGQEWSPKYAGWCVIQVAHGIGYWMHKGIGQEVESGSVLVLGPEFKSGALRASILGEMCLYVLPINPARLVGVFSITEQKSFAAAAAKEESSLKIFKPTDPFAIRMQEIFRDPVHSGVSHRLRALQLFIEGLGIDLKADTGRREGIPGARKRLEDFLARTPAADLVNLKITDVAKATGCGPRHLSRLFQEIFRISFREKQTDLRLARARELLAMTDAKIVEVAMESGYQSVSLFSLMFSKRYGLSPGRWRQKYRDTKKNADRKTSKIRFRISPSAIKVANILPLEPKPSLAYIATQRSSAATGSRISV